MKGRPVVFLDADLLASEVWRRLLVRLSARYHLAVVSHRLRAGVAELVESVRLLDRFLAAQLPDPLWEYDLVRAPERVGEHMPIDLRLICPRDRLRCALLLLPSCASQDPERTVQPGPDCEAQLARLLGPGGPCEQAIVVPSAPDSSSDDSDSDTSDHGPHTGGDHDSPGTPVDLGGHLGSIGSTTMTTDDDDDRFSPLDPTTMLQLARLPKPAFIPRYAGHLVHVAPAALSDSQKDQLDRWIARQQTHDLRTGLCVQPVRRATHL